MAGRATLRVGTCGYQYDHWRGVLYPEGLARAHWLQRYAEVFDSVEIDSTFYGLPSAATVERWRTGVPQGFLYSLKMSRYLSHVKRLREPEEPVSRFVERARRLGPHLGPVLVQLPPRFRVDAGRLDAMLAAAPKDLRWAVELRDRSWLCQEVYGVLRAHGAALCLHDMLDRHPRELTAGFVYLRYHGDRHAGSYSPQRLSAEARRIRGYLQDGRSVFAYFNNDAEGHAVRNALALRRYLAPPASGAA